MKKVKTNKAETPSSDSIYSPITCIQFYIVYTDSWVKLGGLSHKVAKGHKRSVPKVKQIESDN